MNEKLLEDLNCLKESIKESDEYKDVLNKNSLLENSDEVKLLSYKKDMAIVEYEDALKHYNKNSQEVLNVEKVMAKSIYELNNHKLVKEYNASFAKLNNVYEEINQELFSFYKGVKK